MPDLVLIDGGKGQVAHARARCSPNWAWTTCRVVGVAKGRSASPAWRS